MGARIGIYLFHGAEVVDWAAPYGVMAVARRLDPEIDVFLIGWLREKIKIVMERPEGMRNF